MARIHFLVGLAADGRRGLQRFSPDAQIAGQMRTSAPTLARPGTAPDICLRHKILPGRRRTHALPHQIHRLARPDLSLSVPEGERAGKR